MKSRLRKESGRSARGFAGEKRRRVSSLSAKAYFQRCASNVPRSGGDNSLGFNGEKEESSNIWRYLVELG